MIRKTIGWLPSMKGGGNQYGHQSLDHPVAALIGANCPSHPTYPLVWRGEEGWCRRGQHSVAVTVSPDERYVWTGIGDWQPIWKEED